LKILKGGSAEVKPNVWKKFDIELDESDLQAIVVKHNLDLSKMSVINKYQVLVKQADLLVTLQMESEGLSGEKSVETLSAEFRALIGQLPKVEANADSV